MSQQIPDGEQRKIIEDLEASMPEIAKAIDSMLNDAGERSDARAEAIHPQYDATKSAIERADAPEISRLLSAHSELAHAVDEFDDTLLQHALWRGCGAAVEALCRAGADPNRKNEAGLTPLTGLLRGVANNPTNPDYEPSAARMIRLVCSLGAEPNGLDRLAEASPLYYAACWNLNECTRALLEVGANPNTPHWEFGTTPIMCCGHNPPLVRLLLEHGANILLADNNGRTALQHFFDDPEPLTELASEMKAIFDRAFPTPEPEPVDTDRVAVGRAEIRRILEEFGSL